MFQETKPLVYFIWVTLRSDGIGAGDAEAGSTKKLGIDIY